VESESAGKGLNLTDKMIKIISSCYDGRIPKEDKLKRVVEKLLIGKNAADYVIASTDVYMGTSDFTDIDDTKTDRT
jgi:carbonic anhydrase